MSSQLSDHSAKTSPSQVAVDQRTDTAHLMLPMTHDVERFGVSVCGYPAEYLTVVPDLIWAQVKPSRRCEHCGVTPC